MIQHMRPLLVCTCLLLPLTGTAQDELNDLLAKVPQNANTLLAVDMQGVLATPLAAKEKWKDNLAKDRLGLVLPYSAQIKKIVVAAHHESGSLIPKWDVVLLATPVTIAEVARAKKFDVQHIAGLDVVDTGKNAFMVSLPPSVLGVYSPASRQDFARWLRSVEKAKDSTLSDYLKNATAVLQQGCQISLALCLEDAFDPHLTKQYLSQFAPLKEKRIDLNKLAAVLVSIKGLHFRVKIDEEINVQLVAQFDQPVDPFQQVVPGIILNAAEKMGLDMEAFESAQPVVEGKEVRYAAKMNKPALVQLLGVVQPPAASQASEMPQPKPQQAAPAPRPEEDKAKLVKQHYDEIRTIANTANAQVERRDDFLRAAAIYDNASRRIDRLPSKTNDPTVHAFALSVSSKMREIATALQGAIMEVNALQARITYNVQATPVSPGGGYGGGFATNVMPGGGGNAPWNFMRWFPVQMPAATPAQLNVQTNQAEIQGLQAEAIARASKKRLELWRQLIDESNSVRQKLSQQYQIDF